MPKKTIETTTTTTKGELDGKKIEVEVKKTCLVTLTDADKFFMIYITMLKSFYEIRFVKDALLLVKMAELAEYNTGKVSLTMTTRASICTELSILQTNLSHMLKRLVTSGLLIGGKGEYTINAGLFWKGDSKTRKEILKTRGIDFNVKFKMEPNTNFDTEPNEN